MAFQTQLDLYEQKRGDAKTTLEEIKALIGSDNFGYDFEKSVRGFRDLVEDACTQGESLRSPISKSVTLLQIGIMESSRIDDLTQIAEMPENLRKKCYDECSSEFKAHFPDAKAMADSNEKAVERGDQGRGIIPVLASQDNRVPQKGIKLDRRPYNC